MTTSSNKILAPLKAGSVIAMSDCSSVRIQPVDATHALNRSAGVSLYGTEVRTFVAISLTDR